jgi:hypothetical protein
MLVQHNMAATHRDLVYFCRAAPVADAAQAEGMLTRHQPKAACRHVSLAQHLSQKGTPEAQQEASMQAEKGLLLGTTFTR